MCRPCTCLRPLSRATTFPGAPPYPSACSWPLACWWCPIWSGACGGRPGCEHLAASPDHPAISCGHLWAAHRLRALLSDAHLRAAGHGPQEFHRGRARAYVGPAFRSPLRLLQGCLRRPLPEPGQQLQAGHPRDDYLLLCGLDKRLRALQVEVPWVGRAVLLSPVRDVHPLPECPHPAGEDVAENGAVRE